MLFLLRFKNKIKNGKIKICVASECYVFLSFDGHHPPFLDKCEETLMGTSIYFMHVLQLKEDYFLV